MGTATVLQWPDLPNNLTIFCNACTRPLGLECWLYFVDEANAEAYVRFESIVKTNWLCLVARVVEVCKYGAGVQQARTRQEN